MSRADIERAAEEKYPTPGRVSVLSARAEWERAAYVQGRLDQAEEDARIADGAESFAAPRRLPEGKLIAAAIRKGVE